MDDTCGNNMDSGIYRHQLRLLVLLFRLEDGSWDISGATQLPFCGLRHGQGLRVVFWCFPHVFAFVGCHVHGCLDGFVWLRPPMVCHRKNDHPAVCSGLSSISYIFWVFAFMVNVVS